MQHTTYFMSRVYYYNSASSNRMQLPVEKYLIIESHPQIIKY